MRLPPALIDRLWSFAAPWFLTGKRKLFAMLATCLVWSAAAPVQAQVTVTGISASANCDAVTGIKYQRLRARSTISATATGPSSPASVVGRTLHSVRAAEQQYAHGR